MLIAAKFEEVCFPEGDEFVLMMNGAREDLIMLECCILVSLDFEIARPTPIQFFERFQQVNQCNAFHRKSALFILKTAVVNAQLNQYRPSQLAAAALLISNDEIGREELWPQTMVDFSHCKEFALQPCVEEIRAILAAVLTAEVQNKFTLKQQSWGSHNLL